MEKKVLIVLGMHRSGTSMISQWLNKSGFHLGDDLLGATAGNLDGHFEDFDFLNFHEAALTARQLTYSGLTSEPIAPLTPAEKEILKNIIAGKNEKNDEWGWKEPRTCLFLKEYEELIPDAYYLIIVRDFTSSVSSLINRNFIDRDKKKRIPIDSWFWRNVRKPFIRNRFYKETAAEYLKVWIAYNEAILQLIKAKPDRPYILIDYNVLIQNDRSILTHLTDKWHFHLQHVEFNQIYKPKLIGKPKKLGAFVKDKILLKKATDLENQLRSYSW